MANPVCDILLTSERLQPPRGDVDLACGAVVDFKGIVRPLEDGRDIDGIEYEAHHEMAEHQMRSMAREAGEKFSLAFVHLHHRIGFVSAGEASLFLRVGSPHRRAAFQASEWIVDELKKKVPIWKHPKFKIDNVPTSKPGGAVAALSV